VVLVLLLVVGAAPALAQPNGGEMCGDGTTFTVPLPGTTTGIDDSEGLFRVINAPLPPPDSVTLPNGCRIYAIFVSGYANNRHFKDLPFYKVAEFIARNNGYVHFSWWNNLLKEYLGGPLHPVDITVRRLFGLVEDVVIRPGPANPHTITSWLSFAPDFIDLPKANPDEDLQFQQDAARVIRAIREHNPDAIVIVAGHSMGGNAVARLGMNRDLDIDLLAPIDPVGNRDKPRALPVERRFNWTRWRVANQFRGYRQWDCVRNGVGLCRDFDPRLLHTRFECVPVGPFRPVRPVIPTLALIACPRLQPYIDPGTRLGFGTNIRRLYHRWQHEFFWPVDFLFTERFAHPQARSASILGPNYQEPVAPSLLPSTNHPDLTCRNGVDPRDSHYACEANDGHGEIIGHRGPLGEDLPGLQLRNIDPDAYSPAVRRQTLIDMATSDDSWDKRPENPDLCLVCDDMIAVVRDLLEESPPPTIDTTAPVILAEATPGPNENLWHDDEVVVTLTAQDERNGSGVRDIVTRLGGAQPGGGTTAGGSAVETVAEEGTTSVEYYATDQAGNIGTPQTLQVSIDRTPPVISSHAEPPANASGWHRTDVVVTFDASDNLSGLAAAPTEAVLVSTEGTGHEVSGGAEDRAGNAATASALVNLDKTAPAVEVTSPGDGAIFLLHANAHAAYACTDALSGVAACAGPVANAATLDTSSVGERAFTVVGRDVADNLRAFTVRYAVRYGFSGFLSPVSASGNRANAGRTIPVKWRLFDAHQSTIVDPGAVVSVASYAVACDGSAPMGASQPAAGHLHHDGASGQFVFNWRTEKGWAGCRVLELTLGDGATHGARFEFGRRW
jgi:pimeloyl-ACP methyl ester carboxylesterase